VISILKPPLIDKIKYYLSKIRIFNCPSMTYFYWQNRKSDFNFSRKPEKSGVPEEVLKNGKNILVRGT
jgi:hypothetical protein